MKNTLLVLFMLTLCVVGTVLCAAVYYTAAFGLLGALSGASASRIGETVGSATAAMGFAPGVAIFGLLFWDRLVLDDGRPDRVARACALILGLAVALIPLLTFGLAALEAASRFKAMGIFALVGLWALVGWVERKIPKKA
mgnify:CR=1 FL=1